MEDQRRDLANKFNTLKQDLAFYKSELCNLKNTMSINCSLQNEIIRTNLENESLKEEISVLKKVIEKWTYSKVTLDQLHFKQVLGNIINALGGRGTSSPLPKLTGAEPSGMSDSLISLSDLATNMSELTLNSASSKGNKKTSDKVSKSYAVKKKVVPVPSEVHASCSDKKSDSSMEQLLLTLIEEVKGIIDHIKIPYFTSPSTSQTSNNQPSKKV
ncbi:hypothetical protein Tco_0165332, partial [Tanacetum coccineum]